MSFHLPTNRQEAGPSFSISHRRGRRRRAAEDLVCGHTARKGKTREPQPPGSFPSPLCCLRGLHDSSGEGCGGAMGGIQGARGSRVRERLDALQPLGHRAPRGLLASTPHPCFRTGRAAIAHSAQSPGPAPAQSCQAHHDLALLSLSSHFTSCPRPLCSSLAHPQTALHSPASGPVHSLPPASYSGSRALGPSGRVVCSLESRVRSEAQCSLYWKVQPPSTREVRKSSLESPGQPPPH